MQKDEFIRKYLEDLQIIAKRTSQEDVGAVIKLLYGAWKEGRQIFLIGNGGSAATAVHFAGDLAKFASVDGKKRFRAIALTENVPLITAIVNDLGWENAFVEQLKNFMNKGDVLIAVSVHGGSGSDRAGPWSQNLLKAAKFVKENGGRVIGLTGFDGGVLKQISDACIVVPANSTSQVEGFHSVLTHLICARLRELIAKS
jgi:D-sedoheptulose 7-phosphate isomerase